jgi:hypothetical protein
MTAEENPGRAYQKQLVALVGDDDPALVQAQTPDVMRQLVADAGELVRSRPAPGEFSIAELVGHLVDAELVSSTRYRFILAENEPVLRGYEQDDWVRVGGYTDAEPGDLIEVFRVVRRANLDLWRRTPQGLRSRVGHHSERGPESYELSFVLIAGHDRLHIDQARRTLEALRADGPAVSD